MARWPMFQCHWLARVSRSMAVSAADEAAVVGARRSASGNGRSAPRSVSDLPGPPGLPLLGNAHQLARTSRLHLTAEQWARRYGPIIRVNIGRRRIVGISDSEEIHRILRERPDGFRRWSEQEIVVREMGPGEMRPAGVFVAEGENRKRQRRLVITALNTNHLHRYFDVVRTTTERLHRRLTGAARAGRVLDISDELDLLYVGHDLLVGVRARPEHARTSRGRAAGPHTAGLPDDGAPSRRGRAEGVDAPEDRRPAARTRTASRRDDLRHAHSRRDTPAATPTPSRVWRGARRRVRLATMARRW